MFEYDDAVLANTTWVSYLTALRENLELRSQLTVAKKTVLELQEILDNHHHDHSHDEADSHEHTADTVPEGEAEEQ